MAKKYITQDRLKKNTLSDIFIFILEKKQTTRREIEYETGFSWGTVSSNVAFLLEKGYIIEEKSDQNGLAGRTTYLLKPSFNNFASIGLDINRSGLSCEIVTLSSLTVKKFESRFTAKTQKEVIAQSEELCRTAVDWCCNNEIKLFSLGIAIQGAVNGKSGISMHFPGIDDWQAYNIKEHFSEKFGLPVYLGHDPKCMLIGEMSKEKKDDCVLIRIDDGIGMAVSLDGKILDDTERLELGHTVAVIDGKPCNCGRRGCLEAYATLYNIADVDNPEALFRSPEDFKKEQLEAGKYLSVAIYNVYVIFKPKKLILTGKATMLEAFTKAALSLLSKEDLTINVNPEISAAYGAAMESMKSAIKSYSI